MARKILNFLQTMLALVLGTNYKLEDTTDGRIYTVKPEFLGHALERFATKADTIELGYNPETKDFAFIVADINVDPATVQSKLKDGYKLIGSIDPRGMCHANVTGDIRDYVGDTKFMEGIETILATGYADGGVKFRHSRTHGDKIVTIMMTFNVGYSDMMTTETLKKFVVLVTTNDNRVIRFMKTVGRMDYIVTDDGVYVGDNNVSALNSTQILNCNGKIVAKHVGSIDFPDARPVTMTSTTKGFVIGFDDGTNIAVAVDPMDGTVEAVTAKTQYGAILALDLVTGRTVICDDGDTMTRRPVDTMDRAFLLAMGRQQEATNDGASIN